MSDLSAPETTRNSVIRPANGSATVRQTNAEYGACSDAGTCDVAAAVALARGERPIGRRRHVGDERVEQRLHRRRWSAPTCTAAGRASHAATPRFSPWTISSLVSVPSSKKRSISASSASAMSSIRVVAGALRRVGELRPEPRPRSSMPDPSVLNGEGLHRHQVDRRPAKPLLLAERDGDRDDRRGRTPSRSDSSARSRLARSRSSRLRTIEARQVELGGRLPRRLGLHFDAGHGVDDDERGVGDPQRAPRVAQEVRHARRVDEVDLGLVPLDPGQARAERVLAGDLLFVVVGDGRALRRPCRAGSPTPAAKSRALASWVLPAPEWPSEGDVADGGSVEDSHGARILREAAGAQPAVGR